LLLLAAICGPASVSAQSRDLDQRVNAVLGEMSVEDRVGQLFLVTYYGSDTGPDSDIVQLIRQYHVGGVALIVGNDNFTDSGTVPEQIHTIASQLQRAAEERSPKQSTLEPQIEGKTDRYVPLFIGIDQDSSSNTYDNLLRRVTDGPDNMSLGAAWDPALANEAGSAVGHDLSALGVNVLLGPSADVVEVPQPFVSGDLGTQVFGGEPFWVSKMTVAYILGAHTGSNGRLLVFPRHFPGHGAADRVADVEVPTIRRSLVQLTQFDLIPFFAVTGQAPDEQSSADGLVTGHISYRGFQGDNPRLQTRPISLDQQALQALMKLEPITAWRENGGLLVTDALGDQGVRRLYDPKQVAFPNRRIAQDALLAGNDVLYVAKFGDDPRSDQTSSIKDTIDFFVQSYDRDPVFQGRVDDAVRRILKKKLTIYKGWNLETDVLTPNAAIETVGAHADLMFSVAQKSVTLLSPSHPDGLPSPQSGDRIVIFTDTRTETLCSTCLARPTIAVNALQTNITRIYGPQGSAVGLDSIQSYSFDQLDDYLVSGPQFSGPPDTTPVPDNLTQAMNSADWVVLVMQDVTSGAPTSDVVKKFLAVPPVPSNTQIIVLSMGAPYYLDSTEIGKLTAYVAVYDMSPAFVDIATRALFNDVPFVGASPVSVPGVGYNIADATLPSPVQVIKLRVRPDQPLTTPESTVSLTTPVDLNLHLNDKVVISTGIIVDSNGNAVPDGTPVDFALNYSTQGFHDKLQSTTQAGTAQVSLLLTRVGELTITAEANQALQSDTITIAIPDNGQVSIKVDSPDISPTPTILPSETPVITSTPESNHTDIKRVNFRDLLISSFGLSVLGVVAFLFGRVHRGANFGLTFAFTPIITGLFGYLYYALLLPGADQWREFVTEYWGAATTAWLTGVLGLGAVILIFYTKEQGPTILLTGRRRR